MPVDLTVYDMTAELKIDYGTVYQVCNRNPSALPRAFKVGSTCAGVAKTSTN